MIPLVALIVIVIVSWIAVQTKVFEGISSWTPDGREPLGLRWERLKRTK